MTQALPGLYDKAQLDILGKISTCSYAAQDHWKVNHHPCWLHAWIAVPSSSTLLGLAAPFKDSPYSNLVPRTFALSFAFPSFYLSPTHVISAPFPCFLGQHLPPN